MKVNMPVTNQEVRMKKGALLITRTDLKGVITYANDEFVAISGFSRDEIIGADHNIVRHPDMPPAAFEDLWLNLKALRPWNGIVKNRTKSGDYYWVDANAMPVFKNGKVHEYLSVRRMPSRDKIEQAEQLYRLLNDQKATIRPTGLAAMVKAIKEMGVWKKMAAALAVLLIPLLYLMVQLFLAQDYLLVAAIAASVIIASAIVFTVVQSFTTLLNKTIGTFYRLAEKRFGNVQDLARNDLIGDFLRGLYSMEVNLSLDLAQAREEAAKAMRINQALDNVQSGVMLANTDFEIIYTNDSVERIFKAAEQEFRQHLPHFDTDKLIGASIDSFHQDPAHQRYLLENLKGNYSSELLIAGQHMHVIVSSVINDDGEHIGFVAEWQNRTQEVKIEQEIGQLVQDVKAGDLSTRINMGDKQGFAETLSSGINELTDVIESVFNDINRVMESMAEGDLTRSITNDYQGVYAECKNNINGTLTNLSNFIIQIRDAADFIDSSSQEMASGNNNLSSRAEQQAASLEQTAASMQQLASTVRNNAENTQQANQVVNAARQLAQKGGEIVSSAIIAMQDINDSSNEIAEIISVIDEIAFQTNLLALNASVEAARAGEQGRGFSVVATEVRNLAQRSAVAAKQSSDLIQNSVQKVRAGTAFVNETGNALKEIVTSVAQVGELVAQIAGASTEQTAGIDQVNQAVTQMDDITQQNAALAEQAAAGSIAMSEQSTNMTHLLGFFKAGSKRAAVPVKTVEPVKATVARAAVAQPRRAVAVLADNDEWEEF
ncbi:MAG: methyl-accepting chemotaxis protein [Methylobacter sp.]|nr:methyl-accepting chemotaxis protein [Methylobacter sp.]MDP2429854.1 methyl-accepting chemotaxis protein [Methylobacter sp.]MDP3054759.1 methyl-accepting chemotaxis protein [Methylobacter sp.]MDP3362215.1 methyl-accepting chemotaxis protein [Methylobacter sp.]MDZ4218532.1 methyl-accepting chemotaxis protein [Methylobacter sp.]